tara:strand:- start:622 stop:1068 length:447 start_codon:yes stop_codon:yes gene_type:complete
VENKNNRLTMKKLLQLLFSIAILSNTSYASFPITEKAEVESAQISKFGDNDNRNILLLALTPIPLAIISAIAFFYGGSVGFVFGSIFGFTAVISAIYSIYLNLRTYIKYWDWRNYFSILSAFVLGALALFWTLIVMADGGIGMSFNGI